MWEFIINSNPVDEPVGWTDMQVILKRDRELHGIFPEYSFNALQFRCRGADYLKNLYETEGLGAEATLLIRFSCDGGATYTTFWQGKLSVQDVQYVEGESRVIVTIHNQDLASVINSRFDTPVDILDPVTMDGGPVAYQYELANSFPLRVTNDSVAQPLTAEYRAAVSEGVISRILGTSNALLVTNAPTPQLSGGKNGVQCNIDNYSPAISYQPGSVVIPQTSTLPTATNVYRAIVFVPVGPNGPPNPLYWVPVPFTAEEDNGYKAENLLARYVDLWAPTGIPRLVAGRSDYANYRPKMADPAGPLIGNTPNGSGQDWGTSAKIWMRPTVFLNNLTQTVPPNPGITVTYDQDRSGLNRNDAYLGPGKCAPREGALQFATPGPLYLFQAEQGGIYKVTFQCTVNVEAIFTAISRNQHRTDGIGGCSSLPAGCSCPNHPSLQYHRWGQAELYWELRIGSTVFNPFSPGPNINMSSGPVCSRPGSSPWTTANHTSWTTTFNVSGNFAMAAGQGVSLCLDFRMVGRYQRDNGIPGTHSRAVHGLCLPDIKFDNCCFRVERTTEYSAPISSEIPVYPVYEVGQRILDKITDNGAVLVSDLFGRVGGAPYSPVFDGCGSYAALTRGYFIRGMPTSAGGTGGNQGCGVNLPTPDDEDAPIVHNFPISFKEYFDGLNAIHGLGLGVIGSSVRIDSYRAFYIPATITTIDAGDRLVRQAVRRVDSSRTYNLFLSGYTTWQAEADEGLNEFNTNRVWVLPIRNVKNTLNRECKFIASGYLWELTRRQNIAVKGNAAWKYDESVFILQLASIAPYPTASLPEKGIASPVSVLNPATQLNWRLRPSVMLRRWLPWLGQSYFHDITTSPAVIVGKAGGNQFVGGGDVPHAFLLPLCGFPPAQEVRDWDITDATFVPFLRPELLSFTCKISQQQFQLIRTNPYNRIAVDFSDGTVVGYLDRIAYNPVTNDAQIDLIPEL